MRSNKLKIVDLSKDAKNKDIREFSRKMLSACDSIHYRFTGQYCGVINYPFAPVPSLPFKVTGPIEKLAEYDDSYVVTKTPTGKNHYLSGKLTVAKGAEADTFEIEFATPKQLYIKADNVLDAEKIIGSILDVVSPGQDYKKATLKEADIKLIESLNGLSLDSNLKDILNSIYKHSAETWHTEEDVFHKLNDALRLIRYNNASIEAVLSGAHNDFVVIISINVLVSTETGEPIFSKEGLKDGEYEYTPQPACIINFARPPREFGDKSEKPNGIIIGCNLTRFTHKAGGLIQSLEIDKNPDVGLFI